MNANHEKAASSSEAKNLVELLLHKAPASLGAKTKVRGVWRDVPWGELIERTRKLSEGLISLGVQPGDRVVLFAPTRYEWALFDFAIMGAGAATVPIYASNTPSEAEYVINNSGAKVVVVDNDTPDGRLPGRLSRVVQLAGKISTVEKIVAMDLATGAGAVGMADLEAKGAERVAANPRGLEERAARIQSDDLACVLYTSGTTGSPKGVMLTHGNWGYQAAAIAEVGLMTNGDVVLMFLPLAHSFGKVVLSAWLGQDLVVAFAEAIERAVDNAAEVRATVMPAVPRVFEKAYNKVVGDASTQPGLKGRLFVWAMGLFDQYAAARMSGKEFNSLQWVLAQRLVFSKVEERLKARFGGRMKLFISGSAPLAKKIAYFFELCGLVILEGYGLTETSAPTHCNRPGRNRIGTVGVAFPRTETKIAEDGEILVRGPQVMKGYYKLPEESAQMVDAEGWCHTGDIGEMDIEGFLRITDRKKDLIKTSGGKYIAPQELENALKTEPLVSQVLVHGDRRKFVSALFTVNEENARKWAQENNVSFASFADLTRKGQLKARIQAAVDALNATLPSYATIKKIEILDHDWAQDTGELTPSLKVKRKQVAAKYKKILDAFYEGESFD